MNKATMLTSVFLTVILLSSNDARQITASRSRMKRSFSSEKTITMGLGPLLVKFGGGRGLWGLLPSVSFGGGSSSRDLGDTSNLAGETGDTGRGGTGSLHEGSGANDGGFEGKKLPVIPTGEGLTVGAVPASEGGEGVGGVEHILSGGDDWKSLVNGGIGSGGNCSGGGKVGDREKVRGDIENAWDALCKVAEMAGAKSLPEGTENGTDIPSRGVGVATEPSIVGGAPTISSLEGGGARNLSADGHERSIMGVPLDESSESGLVSSGGGEEVSSDVEGRLSQGRRSAEVTTDDVSSSESTDMGTTSLESYTAKARTHEEDMADKKDHRRVLEDPGTSNGPQEEHRGAKEDTAKENNGTELGVSENVENGKLPTALCNNRSSTEQAEVVEPNLGAGLLTRDFPSTERHRWANLDTRYESPGYELKSSHVTEMTFGSGSEDETSKGDSTMSETLNAGRGPLGRSGKAYDEGERDRGTHRTTEQASRIRTIAQFASEFDETSDSQEAHDEGGSGKNIKNKLGEKRFQRKLGKTKSKKAPFQQKSGQLRRNRKRERGNSGSRARGMPPKLSADSKGQGDEILSWPPVGGMDGDESYVTRMPAHRSKEKKKSSHRGRNRKRMQPRDVQSRMLSYGTVSPTATESVQYG